MGFTGVKEPPTDFRQISGAMGPFLVTGNWWYLGCLDVPLEVSKWLGSMGYFTYL